MAESGTDFEGHEGRECTEHRTVGYRAWCFTCSEWCYPRVPCKGCELPGLRAELERLQAELKSKLRRKALGRSLVEMEGFARRETLRADRAEAEAAARRSQLAAIRKLRTYSHSSMGRVYDYVKGADLDAALASPVVTAETEGPQ